MANLQRDHVEEFLEAFEDAWAARDPDRIAAAYTPDVVFEDPAVNETLLGREGVRRFATEIFRMAPDFRVVSTDRPSISPARPWVFVPYRMTGTATGHFDYLDLAPTGRRFEIEGVDRWEMRDGLIAHYRTFYDASDLARQLGMFPPVGSRAESAIMRLQHVQARFQRRAAR